MVGQVSLADALERIEAGSIQKRADGIADLRHILRNNSKFDVLSDQTFHRMYEVLFKATVTEQSIHLKTKPSSTRKASENRLSSCAAALRLAIEVGVRIVKPKTVKSVLDHVIETLLLPSGAFSEPLALDYAKCLRALLGYQAHVEHLTKEERKRLTLFCIECVKVTDSDLAEEDTAPGAEPVPVTGATHGLSYRSSRSHFKESDGSQGGRSLAKQVAEEMAGTICLLTAAPNACSGIEAPELLWALIEFLKKSPVEGRSHQDAFAAINHILAWTRTEDTQLTQKATSSLVRLMKHFWSVRSSSALKDEILVTWIYLRSYMFSGMQRDDNATLRSELSSAFEIMRTEYSDRKEREQLHIEHLRLGFGDHNFEGPHHIRTGIFRLRCVGGRAEGGWCAVHTIATLCNILSTQAVDDASSESDDDDVNRRPRKRQRFTDEFDETLNTSTKGLASARVCALQILAFLPQQQAFNVRQVAKAIDKLAISCTDEDGIISSWALLASASFASQSSATAPSLTDRWSSMYQLASRAMSNTSTCRAACHLLHVMACLRLVSQQSISELVQTMTVSMDLNGPSVLADSVAHLLMYAVKTSQQLNPTSSHATAESVLSRLLRNYLPSRFDDRGYATQHALFEPGEIIDLVALCVGQIRHSTPSNFPVWDTLGQVWIACEGQQELVDYLLLLPGAVDVAHSDLKTFRKYPQSPQPRVSCETLVLNHLISELYRAQENWNQIVREKPSSLGSDAFVFFCNTCYIATCIAFCNPFRDNRRQTQMQTQVRGLLDSLASFIPSSHCSQERIDSVLITVSCVCSGLTDPEVQPNYPRCEKLICSVISRAMETRRANRDFDGEVEDEDAMDLDDKYESQDSRHGRQSLETQNLKNESAMTYSRLRLRSSVPLYAMITSIRDESDIATQNAESTASRTVDYILSLSETAMLSCSEVISRLSRLGIDLTANASYCLLDYFTEKMLRVYQFERSEVALGAILDIMSSLAPAWTDRSNKSLFNLGLDMYEWYTTTTLSAGVLSPSVQRRIASLLLQLCHVDTDYGKDDDVPSVRTSLFKLLQSGSITVQYHIAHRISTIFGLFVLSNHPAMFDDLQMSLPTQLEWVEGMAMRLLFFSKLASAWHSLLRQCVYYIFETAGQDKSSAKHAARSIKELAERLKFDSPQKLFRLFAPQLLHSWLEVHTVTSLPFAVFQFDTLHDLLAQNEAEITAQLLMRGSDEGLHVVMSALKKSGKELAKESFAKCEAYSIAWDISRSGSDGNGALSESRFRNLVGSKEDFRNLLTTQFATIMGHFYLSLQQEDVHDQWLGKRPGYSSAAKRLAEMKSFSHSDRVLPLSQQPSFKSKFLCDQIERLCRRTSFEPVMPWDSSSFALAARMLLDSIDQALGPLHTCLTVRRLRVLICMAGDVAFSGFPLEMLIHTLRPFLSEAQCADDVIGVLQFLFHHGHQYLQTHLHFVYGTIILMVLQMRKHSGARQDSTTQESQHTVTVQKMQNFHAWLVEYLQKCHLANASSTLNTCADLSRVLSQVQLPGNARKGSPESKLLLLLLGQIGVDDAFMTKADLAEALAMISERFETARSTSEDCLGGDDDCARLAQNIWHAIQIPTLSENFLVWACGALGRAYASTGVRPAWNGDRDRLASAFKLLPSQGVARSQAIIAERLSASMYSRDRSEASVAEYTLRGIELLFTDQEEAVAFEQMVPNAIVPAIGGGTYGYEPASACKTVSDRDSTQSMHRLLEPSFDIELGAWAQSLSIALCQKATGSAILPALRTALQSIEGLAITILPCIVHMMLAAEIEREPVLRTELSSAVAAHLAEDNQALRPKQQYLLKLLLYLRGQTLPGEHTQADRLRWLEVDWLLASKTAMNCSMPCTALLFAESAPAATQMSRRSSSRASMSQLSIAEIPQDLLLSIFKDVEEPDSFYGVEQPASLDFILNRLEYERDGLKSLMFRSAQTDTHLRRCHQLSQSDAIGMVRSLSILNLNSLTYALLSGGSDMGGSSSELLDSASRLQQWDIMPPETSSGTMSNCFAVFQELSRANECQAMQSTLRLALLDHVKPAISLNQQVNLSHTWFSALASLIEVSETLSSSGQGAARSTWERMKSRQAWMRMAGYEDFSSILSNRQTLFSVLAQNTNILSELRFRLKDCTSIEIDALLNLSNFAREHGNLQGALTAISQISDLIGHSNEMGLKVDVAAKLETASVLWDSGEATASVRMLQDALVVHDLEKQDLPVGRSGLQARLAHQLAEARLEKPEEILSKYLKPAISNLHGRSDGHEAGEVFHEFATFCDRQLQNPGNIEDLNRITKLRQRKLEEVEELQRLGKDAKRSGTDKDDYTKSMSKAKQWFHIDNEDYQRLKRSRDTYVQQSLQNYLLALRASETHDISILRFFALWLENADASSANAIVNKYLPGVPSWKFVVLLNQLMSRLEKEESAFQKSLKDLALRICSDHPHHSLHHLFASTRRPSSLEQAAMSRYDAAASIRKRLNGDPKKRELLENVFRANNQYNMLASKRAEDIRGSKVALKDLPGALQMAKAVPDFQVPPATINLPLRQDADYKDVPTVTKFGGTISFMSGLSRPKKITVYASDGQQYVQLFKGGNDDLRQDTIMEQVFEEVSKMLRNHKTTRQRKLHVRTYKVIPLSNNSGIIEFVPNSTSLTEFLISAHERYYPQDYKNSTARNRIAAAKDHSVETRIKEFRKVCDHMQPVLRHFFLERFNDPDEWFEKRTAYTRTTATVSILGWVLGLGDRHCQNIMLDEKTGEVVHIDLGVAFEAGRVLPVPELVPFRLTRDIINGMGITKTEGVFRRCCEFTMDALREDRNSIMTLLNVLRYDPLYTWTVSPVRAKRMQEETGRNAGNTEGGDGSSKKKEEAAEADRALSIVEKKLSKTLSTAAAVNELIQQATDERNLATLFHGWSAWF